MHAREPGFQSSRNILHSIKEGMDVIDRDGEKIGKVDWVFFGEGAGGEFGTGAATPGGLEETEYESILEDIAEALAGDENVPEDVRERLTMDGYVRINPDTLLDADWYLIPDQIAMVDEEGVHLNISEDEVIDL